MYKPSKRDQAKVVLAHFLNEEGDKVNGSQPDLIEKKHIITAKLSGTTIEFVDVNGKTLTGVQSFTANMLDANKPFVLSKMKAEYATSVTNALDIERSDYSATAPAILMNGEFKLSQGDRGTIVDMLMDSLINNSVTPNNDDQFHVLEKMEVLKAQSKIEAVIKLPVALPAGVDHYVKITMGGYAPRSK
ncbi:MAG: hypothetical protein COA88_13555 [Kordia sp.]|nr:MAG: hypothetical protein COA88_13555 [Kordia sp.]